MLSIDCGELCIPICCSLAALGGILEVFATAVLAYPASRSVEGFEWTDRQLKACLAANIIFQILASIAGNLLATWFGPVAIVGPIFFAAQLLANLVVFWIVLGLEAFSREMQIGTYVIVVAVILLIVNGPESQNYDGTSFEELITQPVALIWACLLTGAMLLTGIVLAMVNLHSQPSWIKYAVLLTARATAFSLNLSTGKAMILNSSKFWLGVNIIIKIVSGIIYTGAIVVQSTAVKQKVFVPINAATIVLFNALTGIIIWEDGKVVQDWVGYVCVFFLLALGCGLLLGDLGLLQESSPETFMGARVEMVYKENRQDMLHRLKNFGKIDWDQGTASLEFQDENTPAQKPSLVRRRTDSMITSPSRSHPHRQENGAGALSHSVMPGGTSGIPHRPGHRVCLSDTIPSLSHSLPPLPLSPPLERQPSTFLQLSRTHREAWMSVYESAGATSHQNSQRWRQNAVPMTNSSQHSTSRDTMEPMTGSGQYHDSFPMTETFLEEPVHTGGDFTQDSTEQNGFDRTPSDLVNYQESA